MSNQANSKAFELLKPSIFLASMLASEGNFPPSYLDGFQRLIEDVLASLSEEEMPEVEKRLIRKDVSTIIYDSRYKAGLE